MHQMPNDSFIFSNINQKFTPASFITARAIFGAWIKCIKTELQII